MDCGLTRKLQKELETTAETSYKNLPEGVMNGRNKRV
jgi:hypothetical protein